MTFKSDLQGRYGKGDHMTVHQVLHKLWTHSESKLEKYEDKRLWMLLENFVERRGGISASASIYDVRGGDKPLAEIQPRETLKRKLKKLLTPPVIG